jgi:hypothetical protein
MYRAEPELLENDGEVTTNETYLKTHLPPQQVALLARVSSFVKWRSAGGFDEEPLTDGGDV